MSALDRWLKRTREREARAVYLEDALLTGHAVGYAAYRLRFFFGRSVTEAALHVVEFTILAFIFSGNALVAALVVRTLANLASAWWWGALENMRERVRELWREAGTRRLAVELGGWFRLAFGGACLVLVVTVGWIIEDVSRPARGFEVFHLFLLATGLRLSLEMLSRTYHSMVYAVRRVYRPFYAIVLVQLSGLLLTLLLWPAFGAWSLPASLIPSTVIANVLAYHYVSRLYRFLDFPAIRLTLASSRRKRVRHHWRLRFHAAGWAYALTRLDDVLILSLLGRGPEAGAGSTLFVVFYLIRPFLRASFEWAQLFYFDFKRLERGLLEELKQRFARFVSRLAWSMGVIFFVSASAVATWLVQRNLGLLYLLLFLFFVLRSHLAFYQIRAFTEGRFAVLIVTGALLVLCGYVAGGLALGGEARLGVFLVPTSVAMAALAAICFLAVRESARRGLLAASDWLTAVRAADGPVRVRSLLVTRDAAAWILADFADRISRGLRSPVMTLIGGRRLAWCEGPREPALLSERALIGRGGGLVERVESTVYHECGALALEQASARGLLGPIRWIRSGEASVQESIDEIKTGFASLFSNGVVFDARGRAPETLRMLPPPARRELMYSAVSYARNMFRPPRSSHFDVTSLVRDGAVRLIFGIPHGVPQDARARWRGKITNINVAYALGAAVPETREGPMLSPRLIRKLGWGVFLLAAGAGLFVLPMPDRMTGTFVLKPALKAEIRAPVAAFLHAAPHSEGDRIRTGDVIAYLEVPDLESKIAQKRAEIDEAAAILTLLSAGARPEELEVQRARVQLAKTLRERAKKDVEAALHEDQRRIGSKIAEHRAQYEFARDNFERTRTLFKSGAIQDRELRRTETDFHVAQSQYQQSLAELQSREAIVNLQAQSELLEREQDVAEAEATLELMEAGTRPEKLDAEKARLARLQEELAYLERTRQSLTLVSPIDGTLMTADMGESVGRFFVEGELVAEAANSNRIEAEIQLPEQDVARVEPGQDIELKVKALPYLTFHAKVDRISVAVASQGVAGTATVHCRLNEAHPELRPGMSGYARVLLGERAGGLVLVERLMRFVRTEFWW